VTLCTSPRAKLQHFFSCGVDDYDGNDGIGFVDSYADATDSKKHTVSMFRAETNEEII
jgi:hypothetical protein